jgi:hypothetical protein
VEGKSFKLYVDNTVTPTVVSLVGAGNLTLDTVISQINAAVGSTVAKRDNGFLLLESPTTGTGSYLRLEQDATISDVFLELGLFSESVSEAGELAQATHVDPTRQVCPPGQLTLAEGEDLDARAFNRALFQLSVNNDRNEGLLSKKRIASQGEVSLNYTPTGVPTEEGYQFTGSTLVYTGPDATPSLTQLARLFVVLDNQDRELTKEVEVNLGTAASATWAVDSDTGALLITLGGGAGFSIDVGDLAGDVYLVTAAAGAGALQNVRLKILERLASDVARVQNIAADGSTPTPTGAFSVDKIEVHTVPVQVEEVRTAQAGTRVEQVQLTKTAAIAPDRVDKNNRIVVVGADFVTDAVAPGDVLVWAGHTTSTPFLNNGTYRISRVVDKETVEVVAADWGAAYLNPDLISGSPGTITITTDGYFWKDPFIKFRDVPDGAVPANGQAIKIRFMQASTFRDATDDPAILVGRGVRYDQEVDYLTQKALLNVVGPSIVSFEDLLFGDRRLNLEDLDYRLDLEHYPHDVAGPDGLTGHVGRHKAIRPDTVDMFPGVDGETITVRGTAVDSTWDAKLAVRDGAGTLGFKIDKYGHVRLIGNPRAWLYLEADGTSIDGSSVIGSSGTDLYFISDSTAPDPKVWAFGAYPDNDILKLDVVNDGTGPNAFNGAQVWDTAGRVGLGGIIAPEAALHILARPSPLPGTGSIHEYLSNSAVGPTLVARKARGTAVGAEADVQAGDLLGQIFAYGWQNSAYQLAGVLKFRANLVDGADVRSEALLSVNSLSEGLVEVLHAKGSVVTHVRALRPLIVENGTSFPTDPISVLTAYRSDADVTEGHLYLRQDGAGDARLDFGIGTSGEHGSWGVDNSANEVVAAIASGGRVGDYASATKFMRVDAATGVVGIRAAPDTDYDLVVPSVQSDAMYSNGPTLVPIGVTSRTVTYYVGANNAVLVGVSGDTTRNAVAGTVTILTNTGNGEASIPIPLPRHTHPLVAVSIRLKRVKARINVTDGNAVDVTIRERDYSDGVGVSSELVATASLVASGSDITEFDTGAIDLPLTANQIIWAHFAAVTDSTVISMLEVQVEIFQSAIEAFNI